MRMYHTTLRTRRSRNRSTRSFKRCCKQGTGLVLRHLPDGFAQFPKLFRMHECSALDKTVSPDISATLFDDGAFLESLVHISAIRRTSNRQQFDPDILARNWGIDRRTARRMVMSQRNVASEQFFTQRCHGGFVQTTGNSGIDDSQSTVSLTR